MHVSTWVLGNYLCVKALSWLLDTTKGWATTEGENEGISSLLFLLALVVEVLHLDHSADKYLALISSYTSSNNYDPVSLFAEGYIYKPG